MAPARAEPAWATTDFGIFVTLVGKRLKGLAKGPALLCEPRYCATDVTTQHYRYTRRL